MSEHQDSYLIRALLDNDNAVIGEIYRRFAARIERFVCANSGNADDACDVFQDALLAIAHQARKPGFVLRCPFEAYLYLVCRGKWLNELKRRQRAQVTIAEADGFKHTTDAGALADQTLTEEARNRLFVRFFDRLSEKCRAFLKLSWTGLSMEEVSEQMGVSYGYARKKKAECIAQLTGWIRSSPEFVHLK
ncbi:MAG: RNA polymerase sigma factor [Saprospiraceae bacterium]|nr:RNA polymerase sigma factor [Saprospiraceae bacterium]